AKKKRRLMKRCHKLRRRINNLTFEVHRKTPKLLCTEFDIIMIPKFRVSDMVNKKDRNISKRTTRNIYQLETLCIQSREADGIQVLEVDESYTSKTCGSCGKINQALGPNKTFTCPFVASQLIEIQMLQGIFSSRIFL